MEQETHRYLFTVRQRFNSDPVVDSFYKLVSPSGMTSDEMKVMTTLKPGWEVKSLSADTTAMQGMSLRLRFNSDMFQKILLVRSESELDAETLTHYVSMKFRDGTLDEFLEESAV